MCLTVACARVGCLLSSVCHGWAGSSRPWRTTAPTLDWLATPREEEEEGCWLLDAEEARTTSDLIYVLFLGCMHVNLFKSFEGKVYSSISWLYLENSEPKTQKVNSEYKSQDQPDNQKKYGTWFHHHPVLFPCPARPLVPNSTRFLRRPPSPVPPIDS